MSNVTSSFFYGGSSPAEVNTVDELVDLLNQKVAQADADQVAAAESASQAAASAANATTASDTVSALSSVVAETLAAAQSAVDTATSLSASVVDSVNEAAASASSASLSAASASTSATNASTSEANALTYKNSASTSATNAASSEANALTYKNSASTSATNAATSEANALSYKNSAATSATNASTSEANALTYKNSASTSATNAQNSYTTFHNQYQGSFASDPTTRPDSSALQEGDMYFNSSSKNLRVYTGTAWQDTGKATVSYFKFVASAGQTSFSGVDNSGKTLSYTVGFINVFLNGLRLDPTDYTATNGSSIVLSVSANAGDGLNIEAYGTFDVSNTYTKAEADGLLATKAPTTSGTDILKGNGTGGTTAATASDVASLLSSTSILGRNKIINGAMLVDQRNLGTSQTFTAGAALAYCVDRFYGYCTGANITGQQVDGAIANTKRYRFTGAASNTGVGFGTRLEAVNTAMLAGQTATLQVKLSSSALTTITWTAYYANTKDTFGTLASPTRTQIATGSFTINSTEAVYSTQISIPSAATTGIEIVFTGGALLATKTLTIGDVQLEAGQVATPFEVVSYSDILARCRRYYYKVVCEILAGPLGVGYTNSTTQAVVVVSLPGMRIPPVSLDTTGTAADYSVAASGNVTTCSVVPSLNVASSDMVTTFFTVASGLTAGHGCRGRSTNTTAFLGFSSEL